MDGRGKEGGVGGGYRGRRGGGGDQITIGVSYRSIKVDGYQNSDDRSGEVDGGGGDDGDSNNGTDELG